MVNSIQQLTNNLLHGMLVLNPTVGGIYTNNTVRNLTINNAGVTGSVVGINIQASGGGHTITGNTVSNLTTNGTNIAINNAASVVGISMTGTAVGGTNARVGRGVQPGGRPGGRRRAARVADADHPRRLAPREPPFQGAAGGIGN